MRRLEGWERDRERRSIECGLEEAGTEGREMEGRVVWRRWAQALSSCGMGISDCQKVG